MKDERPLRNALRRRRLEKGISQQELALLARVTRQTISGLEAGSFSASVSVALRLARALNSRVEELFWLEEEPGEVEVEWVRSPGLPPAGSGSDPTRVRLARMGSRLLAYPLVGNGSFETVFLPADGIAETGGFEGAIRVKLLGQEVAPGRTAVIAGCDPALSLLAEHTRRRFPGVRVIWETLGSSAALSALARGEVHLAGSHLYDPDSGEFNVPFVRRVLGDRAAIVIQLAYWEEGLLVPRGNPKRVRGMADLARPGVTIINRESGTGARQLLDRGLLAAGLEPSRVSGYETEALGHLEVAQAVASGRVDAGISVGVIARTFGLDFIPLVRERYDLTIPQEHLKSEAIQAILETLDHRGFREELEALGGYDTSGTGRVVARTGRGE